MTGKWHLYVVSYAQTLATMRKLWLHSAELNIRNYVTRYPDFNGANRPQSVQYVNWYHSEVAGYILSFFATPGNRVGGPAKLALR